MEVNANVISGAFFPESTFPRDEKPANSISASPGFIATAVDFSRTAVSAVQ
jgi:hypothetical protein